jgi:hypothetical protein
VSGECGGHSVALGCGIAEGGEVIEVMGAAQVALVLAKCGQKIKKRLLTGTMD